MTPAVEVLKQVFETEAAKKLFARGGTTSELWASVASIVAPIVDERVDPLYTVPLAIAYLVARTGLKWIRAWRSGDVQTLQREVERLREAVEKRTS